MKKYLIFWLSALCLLASCGSQASKNKTPEAVLPRNGVEVLSFHAKKRCPTCIAIEHLTGEVIRTEFAARLADSSLTFRVVDIAKEGDLADKYEVTWSSLLVVGHKDGVETLKNLTQFAFANARTNPERFTAGLKAEIENLLKP